MADNENVETTTEEKTETSQEVGQETTEEQPTEQPTENAETQEESKPSENGNGEAKEESKTEAEERSEDQSVEEGGLINATESNEAKMFVGGLSWDTETFGLKDYFLKFGEVKDCIIKKDSQSERSRGFGFVLFADPSSVQKVLDTPSHYLDGRKIDPKRAQAQRKDGKLFVGGINPETEDEKIKEHFSKFGEIGVFERPLNPTTKKGRGYCFITFKKDGILKQCCAEKTQELDGTTVEVKEAQNPERAKQKRFGGGFMRGGGFGGGGAPSFGHGGFNYGGYDYNYSNPYGHGGYGFGGGFPPGGYGNYSGFGAYGGGGKTAKVREGSGRPRGGGWGDTSTRSSHTNWYGNRGNFHGAYQGYHDY